MQKFEDILLAEKKCTQDDIEQAYSIRKEYGGQIGNILLNLGSISDIVYVEVLAKQYNFKLYRSFSSKPDIISIAGLVTDYFILNNIFPIKQDEKNLYVVTHNPLQSSALATIESAVKKQLIIYLATEEELRQIKDLYESNDEEEDEEDVFEDEVDKLKEIASEAPVIKLVNNIFSKAVNAYVSDIHFESYKYGIKVRFRIDGVLQTMDTIPNKLKQAVTARLKLISKMNISENRLPQDGRISIKISSQEIDIRSSSVPTAFGESFVLRFLGNDAIDLNIDNMGFHQDNLKLLKEMLKKPNGILLTTGPTGSGKTSTLYAALNYINDDAVKIITVEDPVEYQLDGISQIQVKANIDYTFANALRSILRQDPDVILIGEIRDTETAKIAIQSALTGHLVLSTLHTNSAIGAISRLLDMEIEYFLLKSSIVGLMAQRLARRLCVHCKKPIAITPAQKNAYDIQRLSKYIESAYNPCQAIGCKECNYTGYKGRIPIVEIIPFNDAVIKELDENKDFKDIQKLGYRTLQDDAVIKFLEGNISLDEVVKFA